MPAPKRTYALLLQTESDYGIPVVTARVVYTTLDEPKTLLSPSNRDWNGGEEYADFAVHAYLANRPGDEPIWGPGHSYNSQRVELRDAERMIKLLRKVDKGLEKLRQEEGWLAPTDYCGYVLRIARILGIKTFYVHADEQAKMHGLGKWRKLDGSGVQSWLGELADKRAKMHSTAS